MANIKVDVTKSIKKIKPMHGGGQPPIGGLDLTTYFHYLTEAGIPYSRLHDVGGNYGDGRFVDIPNLFRNFDADENDPANYDFAFTDVLIKGLMDAKCEPYFRLGVTIENSYHIKAYHIHPPKDYDKWARICEHVIAHYTQGWADGFHYNIRYWEIWNEPENKMMWSGTKEEFYRLYDVTAKHLKARFPDIMIGGYGNCGLTAALPESEVKDLLNAIKFYALEFFEGFFAYIKEHNSPIDFFSWHSYTNTKLMAQMDKWLHNRLEELGYGHIETHLNEWDNYVEDFGTAHQSAETAATMIAMQHGYADVLCIYDMKNSSVPYCPLFDVKTKKPVQTYYSMVSFNVLYKLGTQVMTDCDTEDLYVLAASDGTKNAMMIANLTGKPQTLDIEGVDLSEARIHVIDEERLLSWAPNADVIDNNMVILIEW